MPKPATRGYLVEKSGGGARAHLSSKRARGLTTCISHHKPPPLYIRHLLKGQPKPFALNPNPLKVLEIKDFNALSGVFWSKLIAKRCRVRAGMYSRVQCRKQKGQTPTSGPVQASGSSLWFTSESSVLGGSAINRAFSFPSIRWKVQHCGVASCS